MKHQIINANCCDLLKAEKIKNKIALAFLDPPFNQQKDYTYHNDNMPDDEYWAMMQDVCNNTFKITEDGGAIYFMQREKNEQAVLKCLRDSGYTLQNLIIWKKKTSAVPVASKFGKQYQIIAYATKGQKAKTFNRLRIDPPLPANYKFQRENGMFVNDVWGDIRELTSGFFAGGEAIRNDNGKRFHKQQSPIGLLVRIIASSTRVGDLVFDQFAGTGTTLIAAKQLKRNSIGIEIDPANVKLITSRINNIREDDLIDKIYQDYKCTENLDEIWGSEIQDTNLNSNKKTFDKKTHELNLFSQLQ